jgi:hypothetical protein
MVEFIFDLVTFIAAAFMLFNAIIPAYECPYADVEVGLI